MSFGAGFGAFGSSSQHRKQPLGLLGGKAPRKAATKGDVNPDYSNQYDSLNTDILGEDNDSDEGYSSKASTKPKKKSGFGETEDEEKTIPYMFFDFRRGKNSWPANVKLLDQKQSDVLLEKATLAAEEAAKMKKKDDKEDGDEEKKDGKGAKEEKKDEKKSYVSYDDKDDDKDDVQSTEAPSDATFETLKDGSSALIIKAGYRLKLNLSELLEGGDEKKAEREAEKVRKKKRKEKYSSAYSGYGGGGGVYEGYGPAMKSGGGGADDWDDWDAWEGGKKWGKDYVNKYTITMDMKLLEEPPREGISLFQTALIHTEENKRTGKTTLKRSDGECIVSQGGGVGMFGTYGDTSKARVSVGVWKRVVITVKCAEQTGEKGEMRTWVGTEPGVVLKEDSIVANERFAIDPENLFLFSSAQASMMPGNIAVRSIRVEQNFCTDQDVKEQRARDKVLSIFMEDRKAEVEKQRKGLCLAELFAKPRPMWNTLVLVGVFGDAFIENTVLEGGSNLAWSYTVLNLSMQRVMKSPLIPLETLGLNHEHRVALADTLHVMQQSTIIFKHMLKMLKNPSESQLLSFLKKLRKILQALNVGESLLLPAIVEQQEILIILERTTERLFKVVVIQTDPFSGLKHHSGSATSAPPTVRYRTCMVLNDVAKKNALDDVFWVALYNMAINSHGGDTEKFYDVLIPFLTGKPLEVSLVEAETAALQDSNNSISKYGEWRLPQRSSTAYVRCILEALHFMLRRRNVPQIQADQVHLALCVEMVCMLQNDLNYMLPDDNGRIVCSLAVRELSHTAVRVVDAVEAASADRVETMDTGSVLREVHNLVESVNESLSFCRGDSFELPPEIDLSGPKTDKSDDPALVQFQDLMAWDVPMSDPDPGQAVALGKYIPVDLLQIPKKASTRSEAISAIRLCDRLSTLIDNQAHCIKNTKFLIAALIEHVFSQVIPIPKPRAARLNERDMHRSGRASRRAAKRTEEESLRAAEKKKRLEIKRQKDLSEGKKDSKIARKRLEEKEEKADNVPTKVKCYGEELMPDFSVGKEIEQKVTEMNCIWDEPISYALQVELLLSLQRIVEHFAAAVVSIQQSRPFDAVCVIIPGAIATISDAIMRQLAQDDPSEACAHLMGRTITGRQLGHPGFGISVGSFATQSETIEVHTPELNIARTAIIDYFQSPEQRRLEKMFSWEEEYILKPGKNLIKYIRAIGKDVGLPLVRPNAQLLDAKPMSSQLMKNYPEMRCYRDVVFWWKYFLNTDRKAFPNYSTPTEPKDLSRIDRMNAQLVWDWDEQSQGYQVTALGMNLKCRPDPNQINPLTNKKVLPENLPTHRYPSTATPSFYVPLPLIKTEDDVIYRPNLPSFEDKYGQVLNQRDSELLISYLTVPYMRIPLLLTFFSSDDRIHKLQSKELRLILDSVLFEPGKYLAIDMSGVQPLMVPTLHPELLATPYGLLINEFHRSPDTILRCVLALVRGALAVDTGSVVDEGATEFNTSTIIILYVTRLAARIDNYLSFMIDWSTNMHDCVDAPLRDVIVSDETLAKLIAGRIALRDMLCNQYDVLFEDYLRRLDSQIAKDPNDENLIDINSRLACDLHSHKLLLYRNFQPDVITTNVAKTLVGSFVYLTTRHTWNKATVETARLQMPETALYELLQVQRRRLIVWASTCRQGALDEIMQTALQVSSSLTGSLKASAAVLDNQNRWSRIQGDRSIGRWAVGSTRTQTLVEEIADLDMDAPPMPKLMAQKSHDATVGEIADTGMLGVEIDVQMGQMTLRSKHLTALVSNIANHPDCTLIFGDATIQASLVEKAEHRERYRLVGLNHELEYWQSAHTICPPLGDEWERDYDPADLYDSERWIIDLFEPVRKSFFDGPSPPPMQFLMPEKALSEDAEIAVLLGLHQKLGGPWKLVYLFRRLRCVHVYECVTQGREWWYSLHMTTDTRYSLREMQPSKSNRANQFPEWWIRGAGSAYPGGVNNYLLNDLNGLSAEPHSSVLILREQQHHLNLSGGKETLVPSRLMHGLIPEALLDAYIFWQDESIVPRYTRQDDFFSACRGYKKLRGYPVDKDGEFIIFVEIQSIGNWEDHVVTSVQTKGLNGFVIQGTGLPGRTVRVIRRPKKIVEEEFRLRQRMASLIESLRLMVPFTKKKVVDEDADAIESETKYKMDAPVECDYEGKGEYWPCVVRRINDNGTYDIEYVDAYKWLGIQRGIESELIQKRGESEKKKRGEGIWHWDGMSDSEEDDWREDSDNEDSKGNNDDNRNTKERISFFQFDELESVFEAASFNEDLCLAALQKLGNVPGVNPFNEVSKLAAAVRGEVSSGAHGEVGERTFPPFDRNDMVLLNLLYAPKRSRLHSVLKVLSRIENVSHLLPWTSVHYAEVTQKADGLKFGCPPIDLIELPRLKLAFTMKADHEGVHRLYSVDHIDLYICNERNALTSKMLAGIPHSLLLSNIRGETQVLVPVIPPVRPIIGSEPFSTFIVLDRANIPLSERFFLYPVHVSLSFLLTKGLNSAVYLMLLRFLHRDYEDVFRLADSIATDTSFNSEGENIFQCFANTNDDWHPDAHACRMKISLVTIDSDTKSPWDLTTECSRHVVKLDSVSSSCRLASEEELQLLESDLVATSTDSKAYNKDIHDEYTMALCYNRLHQLRAQLSRSRLISNEDESTASTELSIKCKVPPRALSSNWPFYQDNTVFGENYACMLEVTSASEGDKCWKSEVKGGDETDAPPGGWLVVACFHTLWSAGSVKVMPNITELVPLYQDMVTFLTVRADCHGMAPISKELNIKTFPTFLILRGGVEVERIEGAERAVERMVRCLNANVRDDDKVCRAKHRHRVRLEKAIEMGEDVSKVVVEEEVKQQQIDWTWDNEQCGESMRIEYFGMCAVLKPDNEDEFGASWEHSANNRTNWTAFSPKTNAEIEAAYKRGDIYNNGWVTCTEVEFYPNSVKITSYEITGFYGNFRMDDYRSVHIRRRGDRCPVPGEDNYLSKEQKERDSREAEWRKREEEFLKELKAAKIGKDIEGIKGAVGLLPNTGVHNWTLRWNHEPSRLGVGDAFGVCGDACEKFGPMSYPLFGGNDSGVSLALYADGNMYHNNKVLSFTEGFRKPPEVVVVPPPPSQDQAQMMGGEGIVPAPALAGFGATSSLFGGLGAAASTISSGGFGAASTKSSFGGFGAGTSFGASSATSSFGGFGAATSFGAASTTSTFGGFGASTSFGATSATSSLGGFGAATSTTSLAPSTSFGSVLASQPAVAATDASSTPSGEVGEDGTPLNVVEGNEPAKPAPPPVEVVLAPLFGKGCLVSIELDTASGGVLTFKVDGTIIADPIQNVYELLGASEIFPVLCLAPLDEKKIPLALPPADGEQQVEMPPPQVEEIEYPSVTLMDLELERMVKEQNDAEARALGLVPPSELAVAPVEVGGDANAAPAEGVDNDANAAPAEGVGGDANAAPAEGVGSDANAAPAEGVGSDANAAPAEGVGSDANAAPAEGVDSDANGNGTVESVAVEESKDGDSAVPSTNTDGEVVSVTQPTEVIVSSADETQNDAVAVEDINAESAVPSDAVTENVPTPPEDAIAVEEVKVVEVVVAVDKIRWMRESDMGWSVFSAEISRDLEEASREGISEYKLTIGESSWNCNLESKKIVSVDDTTEYRLRRHILGDGLAGQWEVLTMKYEKPMGLSGQGLLKTMEKIWQTGETMDGKAAGLGFLFLYALLTGDIRAKVISGDWGSNKMKGYGPYTSSGYGKSSSSSTGSDSHRFALLMTQLLVDKHMKSLPASVVNVLCRNRQVSLRMPKFKDTRKANHVPYYNGWTDDLEPRSPLAELFSKLVPTMTTMKRKGAFHFPPPPPHPELPAPASTYVVSADDIISGSKFDEWDRPALSDYACEHRTLEPVLPEVIKNLASSAKHRLGTDSLRPELPVHVTDSAHFDALFEIHKGRLIVVDFFATWCGPCKALAPAFRRLSMQLPTVVFLKVDINECDDLAIKFQIAKLPIVKFMRGGSNPSNVLGEIQGMGAEFFSQFSQNVTKYSTPQEQAALYRFVSNAPAENIDDVVANMSTSDAAVKVLAHQPLQDVSNFVIRLTRQNLGLKEVSTKLAFDVRNHEASNTAVAHSVLSRIYEDVEAYANYANNSAVPKIINISDLDISNYFDNVSDADVVLQEALTNVKDLLQKLYKLRDSDSQMVQDTVPLIEKASNWVSRGGATTNVQNPLEKAKSRFLLNRFAGQNSFVWIDFLFGILLSSQGEDDLLKLNPYLSSSTVKAIMNLVTTSMLRANRLGHTNRCIGTVIGLENLLTKILNLPVDQRKDQKSTLMPKLIQQGEDLAKTITMARHYVTPKANGKYDFDPRYLVFEFVWNIQLRKKQVEIVNNFRDSLANDTSKVKQMIMGAGKTSVVAPLLALILADGKSLVLSVVPKALVEMSRTRMRETFAAIMVKRIYTLEFDRSTTVNPAMRRGLENAASNRGVVVATPTTIKSIMLSYIEVLQHLKEAHDMGMKTKVEELKIQAQELAKILQLFRDGVMLLDEVDLILHPLKSELNFPIGDKFDLDGSEEGERWNLPIHLFDAIFYYTTSRISTFEQRGIALDILRRLSTCISQGIAMKYLQRLPHVILLNVDYYHSNMKPILAEWSYLWLQKQHLFGIDRSEAVRYMLEGAAARSDVVTKINLIDLAITKTLVAIGEAPPLPLPTLGYQKSMTEDEKTSRNHTLDEMKEQNLKILKGDEDLEMFLEAQLEELKISKAAAESHRKLVNEVYDMDEQVEEHARNGGRKLGELQGAILALHKKIGDLECPRDNSLDNSVVVWLSQAFANVGGAGGGSATPGETSVPSICNILEDAGLTIKRCSDPEEAVSRARELQLEGQLRCVIIGGDEKGVGCGPSCVKNYHSGPCLRCGQQFHQHYGHSCPFGGRGSWAAEGSGPAIKINALKIMEQLTDKESSHARLNGEMPAARTAVFSAHSVLKEEERLSFWTLGTTVTDDHKHLTTWITSLPSWNGSDATLNNDNEQDDEYGGVAEHKEGDAKLDDPPPANLPIMKQSSSMSDKTRIINLRQELEALEQQKDLYSSDEDTIRKKLLSEVAVKHKLLESSVNARLEVLTSASKEFRSLVELSVTASDNVDLAAEVLSFEESKKCYVGPHSGRESAIAIAWLKVYGDRLKSIGPDIDTANKFLLRKHYANVECELSFLKQMALAAKVVAHVTSPIHKKLLNLCHNWLDTFMPHCLAKINRVSFGLLSADDCKAALEADPHVPRSRLKLAVPFVGKDVPSKSSEFAHPDVIIGLTVLAYRYSGLRKDDFIDIVDGLTSQFSHEIGPARDRESSQRHERWVFAAGGAIRGLKTNQDGLPWVQEISNDGAVTNEVVQLKFLQKSNEEQMDKLYGLIHVEPSVLHYYLQKNIFPLHMRSQRRKISASGQAVGGDMLVGKRVGFSGTPSDLLPEELGRCDYETGDDGMMLTTVLDRDIASYEFLQDYWTVEQVLQRIATADNPRYNALIDTGALITGYSNKEVAQQLLERGLEWCDGVVFLDDDDKQQVYVRATGRVVSADQCGVPLERRFAFYDQIHTTGMDIKHVVNATAVITLGKDMVFRDYVQGAYRMRGIGAGQKIHVFIIPEVSELIGRELKECVIANPSYEDTMLEKIVAWLIINSLRSEQVQWTMLCLQNIGNLYRKNAFQALHSGTEYFIEGKFGEKAGAASEELSSDDTKKVEGFAKTIQFASRLDKNSSLQVFDEPIDFSLEASVPDPMPFEAKLRSMLDDNEAFLQPEQHAIGHRIMVVVGQFDMIEGSANRLDTEQEREQEQEQEKEVEARRDQQIEVEKFVDREYSRQEEVQRPWPFTVLSKNISTTAEHPFYLLKDFKLRHQEPLEFANGLYLSSNYFNPNWTGLRRVKNVIMLLEYAPNSRPEFLRLLEPDEIEVKLNEEQENSLRKAHRLLGFYAAAGGNPDYLNHEDLKNAIEAVVDEKPSEKLMSDVIAHFSVNHKLISLDDFRSLLTCGKLHPTHTGRHWVAVSLAEAETIRRILHVRKNDPAIIQNAHSEMALRYSPMCGPEAPLAGDGGVVFDASMNWRNHGTKATAYEASVAHASFRFFDCDMYFASAALNILIRVLRGSIRDRERFFHSTIGARRRMERKWQDTPLAKIFMVPDEWQALKQRAQAVFVREALKAKNLSLWEAFTAFDYDNSGVLNPSEFYGALVWLGVPNLTAEDAADFIEAADTNRDGMVDYKEYMDYLSNSTMEEESAVADAEDKQSNREAIMKIEPYGAEELREVMVHRKQMEQQRLREERLRRQAYKDALDVKVFEEELEASKARKGGANPAVSTELDIIGNEGKSVLVTDFKFSTNQNPLRLTSTGKSSFIPIYLGTAAYGPFPVTKCPKKHDLGSQYYSWMSCTACKTQGTHWYCASWCGYYICQGCYDGDRKMKEIERKDPAKNPTYLRCSNGCSFTLQVPTAGGADPETGRFSLTMEVRLEKLPPSGHLLSLLRLSLPDLAQTRRLHRTSVYINGDGIVVGKPMTRGGGVAPSDTAGEAAKQVVKIKGGAWQIVTVVVDPDAGKLSSYINGELCHEASDLEPADLRLHYKFVALGGGKQAHSRGGDIRRIVIHGALLGLDAVKALYFKLANDHPFIGGRVTRIQTIYRGWIIRKKYKLVKEKEVVREEGESGEDDGSDEDDEDDDDGEGEEEEEE